MSISETKWYSRRGLWHLFLICAFPIHVWTIVLSLRDFSWVAERTNTWDAIGVLSYGLVYAFIESLAIFLVVALLGFLVSRIWEESRRIAVLCSLVLIVSAWAIVSQSYFLLDIALPGYLVHLLVQSEHPVRILYAGGLALVLPTVLIPTYLILRSNGAYRLSLEIIDRLTLVSTFYLAFDLAGLVIVLVRNL